MARVPRGLLGQPAEKCYNLSGKALTGGSLKPLSYPLSYPGKRELMLYPSDPTDPVTLLNPKRSTHIRVRALLDSGCNRDLISLIVVIKLGLDAVLLKEQLWFEQKDGMFMGGDPWAPWIEKVPLGRG